MRNLGVRGLWAAVVWLCALSLSWTAAAEDWWQRSGVWQEEDWIYAVGRSSTERGAEARARQALAGALRTALPGIDADLAAASAAVDARHPLDDRVVVRLVFVAAYGEACNRAETWLAEGHAARASDRQMVALESYAQAAWRDPMDAETIDSLAAELAEYGLWYAAAGLLDDAFGVFREPPLTMLRNRVAIHIWMENRDAAERAMAAVRANDPADPELQTLEAMVRATRFSRFVPTEKVVMLATAQTLDAELASRFAAWRWRPAEQRRAQFEADLAPGDVPDEVTIGLLRFEDLRGWWDADGQILSVEDRLEQTWRVTVDGLGEGGLALAHAGAYEPPAKLIRENHPIQLGGAFPLHPYPGTTKIQEVWVRPMYYSVQREIPDRLRLMLFVRSGEHLSRILVDGPIGLARDTRPGMGSAPQVTEMLLLAMRPAGVEKPEGSSP